MQTNKIFQANLQNNINPGNQIHQKPVSQPSLSSNGPYNGIQLKYNPQI